MSRPQPRSPIVLLAALLLCAGALPAAAQAPIDVDALGPQVGDAVPGFTLRDQTGAEQTLESLMGPEGLMLVFFRSADWCPWCKTQLVDLQEQAARIRASGLGLAAISYDPVPVLADFAQRRGITFPLLSDAGSSIIRAYGILNTTVAPDNTRSYGIPFPGTFFLDTGGRVVSREFEAAYQERVTAATMLLRRGMAVDGLVDGQQLALPQLRVTLYPSDPAVAPGHRFSLVADVVPDPGMHVYAPGGHSYQVIDIRIAEAPLLIVGDAVYPASELYHFEPLNETVEVFQDAFRVTREVMLDPAAREALTPGDTLTIEGSIEYQACDDRICYFPQSRPVSWTVTVAALDTELANVP